jgi:carboxymethylenebutenolidase
MPTYNPNRVEYGITTGNIQIVAEGGKSTPAYWAHPNIGSLMPAVALVHDWWGITPTIRHLANLFAQLGYYVVVPDLFNGHIAHTPQEAMELVRNLGAEGFPRIDAALSVLEKHSSTNSDVAAVGIGMGGSLAFEAAIARRDLEAAVAFSGFPQRYFGRFKDAHTPILAFYGKDEPHVPPAVIDQLRRELAASPLGNKHQVIVVDDIAHDFFGEGISDRSPTREALSETFNFLDTYLRGPTHPK